MDADWTPLYTPIFAAAAKGDLAKVTSLLDGDESAFLLEKREEIHYDDPFGYPDQVEVKETALHLIDVALANGSDAVAALVAEKCPDPWARAEVRPSDPLREAARRGFKETVERLLGHRARPDGADDVAAKGVLDAEEGASRSDMIEWLARRGSLGAYSSNALAESLKLRNLGAIRAIVALGTLPDTMDFRTAGQAEDFELVAAMLPPDHWITPEAMVAEVKRADFSLPTTARNLLTEGPRSGEEEGRNGPLRWAARQGYAEVVRRLLDRGADPKLQHSYGECALTSAAEGGSRECVDLLLDACGIPSAEAGSKALANAAERGHVQIVSRFLAAGVDPNDGYSAATSRPITLAARGGHAACVRALLEAKADPTCGGRYDPLVEAAAGGHVDAVRVLLEAGVDPRVARAYDGRTPLMAAARGGHAETVSILIAAGADPATKDKEGVTALDEAQGRGSREAANLNKKDKAALDAARAPGRAEAAKLIEAAAAAPPPPKAAPVAPPPFVKSVVASSPSRALELVSVLGLPPRSGFGIDAVAFSPDGKRALSGGRTEPLRLWDMEALKEKRVFNQRVSSIAFTPDGRTALVATARGGGVVTVDSGREEVVSELPVELPITLAISADGKRTLISRDNRFDGFELFEDGRVVREFRHGGRVGFVGFLDDGRALSGSSSGSLKIWDVDAGRMTDEIPGFDGRITAIGGGLVLSLGEDGRFYVVLGGVPAILEAHGGENVFHVAVARDGRRALSSGGDNTVRVWDLFAGSELGRIELDARPGALAFAPDGSSFLAGTDVGCLLRVRIVEEVASRG